MSYHGRHRTQSDTRHHPRPAATCRAGLIVTATLGITAGIVGLVSINGRPPEAGASHDVILGVGPHSVTTEDGGYQSTVTETGWLVAIAENSVSVQSDDGVVHTYAITAETSAVLADGLGERPLAGQFTLNAPVIVVANVARGTAIAVSLVDQGAAYPEAPHIPMMLV